MALQVAQYTRDVLLRSRVCIVGLFQPEAVDDAIQKAFLQFSDCWSENRYDFKAFALRARSNLLDEVRKEQRQRGLLEEMVVPVEATRQESTPPSESDLAAMHAAIEKLPSPLREVIKMRVVEGLEAKQIASKLDISLAGVYRAIAQAGDLLRIALADRF